MGESTFKEENRALQELVREWKVIRAHNLQFKDGDDQATLCLFSEGALLCVICEHLLRMVIEKNEPGLTEGKQLRFLLDTVVSKRMIMLPFKDQEAGKKAVCDHRNALLHGNFAQAAKQAGCATVAEYFGKRYAAEVHAMENVVDFMMQQIDVNTGAPIPGRPIPVSESNANAPTR